MRQLSGAECAVCVAIGLVVGSVNGMLYMHEKWRKWSIEVNAAHYDAVTGQWTAGPRPVNMNSNDGCEK